MTAPRDRRHILVPDTSKGQHYTPHPRAIEPKAVPPPPNRTKHAAALSAALQSAEEEGKARQEKAGIAVTGAPHGLYITFDSVPGVDLNLKSLEHKGRKIELCAVTTTGAKGKQGGPVQRATVFVPEGALKHFSTRFAKYGKAESEGGEAQHKDMIDRIERLGLATLSALWTDPPRSYPKPDEVMWWEIWLRRRDGAELEDFETFATSAGIELSRRRLIFDDRTVVLARTSAKTLSSSLDVLSDVAEVRKARESPAAFVDMTPAEQVPWVKDLLDRLDGPAQDAPAVCILDTGVNTGHPLIGRVLSGVDCHSCDPTWGTHDHHGHGTEMAGLAAYGDLTPLLASAGRHRLKHRLESVKILPPSGRAVNRPELHGALTAEAVGRPEIVAPRRPRCFSMAVTREARDGRGQPTSWSAAVDALAAGRTIDTSEAGLVYLDEAALPSPRLLIVSAGQVQKIESDYLQRNDLEPVEDPGQAWNALTVGAYTDLAFDEDGQDQERPLARPGDLSPWSPTSVPFAALWPIKPDVVLEGGNLVLDRHGLPMYPIPTLSVLSTHFRPAEKLFVLSCGTSAATAQAARMAAMIAAEYPSFWPETIRGMIVHSAEWTAAMRRHMDGAGGKRDRLSLVRRYGFGVPDLARALRSARGDLTLIVQGTIHPFRDGTMGELRLHALPWPREVLEGLGEADVCLRVTLSYFVEPNPARRGWKGRYSYASHGLRFEVKLPTESPDGFRKRINKQALAETEKKPSVSGDSLAWTLGEQARSKGSLHADIWRGSAADLAARGYVAVYPVSGWWKDLPKRDRSSKGVRYSLIMSITTEATEIDIWTPVALQVGIPIEVAAIET